MASFNNETDYTLNNKNFIVSEDVDLSNTSKLEKSKEKKDTKDNSLKYFDNNENPFFNLKNNSDFSLFPKTTKSKKFIKVNEMTKEGKINSNSQLDLSHYKDLIAEPILSSYINNDLNNYKLILKEYPDNDSNNMMHKKSSVNGNRSKSRLNKSIITSYLNNRKNTRFNSISSEIRSIEILNTEEPAKLGSSYSNDININNNNSNNYDMQNTSTTANISNNCCFKAIVIGNTNVGKTSFLKRIKFNSYDKNKESTTMGFDYFDLSIKMNLISFSEVIKLAVWDTSGMESYRSLIANFFKNAELAIIFFSIDNIDSFNSIDEWVKELRSQASPDIKIVVIGNKKDLENESELSIHIDDIKNMENNHNGNKISMHEIKDIKENLENNAEARKVFYNQVKEKTEKLGITFLGECSVLTGENVLQLFKKAASMLYWEHLNRNNNFDNTFNISQSIATDDSHTYIRMSRNSREDSHNNKSIAIPSKSNSCSFKSFFKMIFCGSPDNKRVKS